MQYAPPSIFTVQFLRAKIVALESAGDALTKFVPKSSAKAKRAVNIWHLTKEGGKRADKK